MPLGWYLAQGLYPLTASSSDDEEGPCELPDGRIVCGPHGLVSCGKCCTDYSFMSNHSSKAEKDEDDSIHEICVSDIEKRRGVGRVIPTKFNPPTSSITPRELFQPQRAKGDMTRYIHRTEPRSVLVFTDGACLNNGQPDPKAGWAFVHGPRLATTSGRLESKGPFGDDSIQSSNRAELRAVLAALRFRHWPDEGFDTMIIATDSEYVVEGSTKWASTWIRKDWKTSGGAAVKNKDLWELLLGEFERWDERGLAIQFWRIPRNWNETADEAAKEAASYGGVPAEWSDVVGGRW